MPGPADVRRITPSGVIVEALRHTKPRPHNPGQFQAWRSLTKEAGLTGLRFHDLRHPAITELAESGASDQTIMSIAGHVSRKMLDRYSHIRMEAKRNALEVLSNRMPNSYGTKSGTNGATVLVYTDLSSTGGINRVKKKLEVATVPEKRPHPKFRTEW